MESYFASYHVVWYDLECKCPPTKTDIVNSTMEQENRFYLQVEHLTKMFGTFEALSDISFEVFEGELICFLGPSGCGKTTLLRCIAGLDIQTTGRVIQAGKDISILPPTARDFGIVFQSYALFPNLTVQKNLAYGLKSRHMKKEDIKKRVTELLSLVGLSGHEEKYPSQLSGGQQQRIALARALATWPGLLLLDEPLSALDAKVRVHLRHEIKELQRQLGITTIMVTHDQEEGLTMADRIVVMNHGTIAQVGTPIEIYRNPATEFVADFVGTMNFLPGKAISPQHLRLGEIEIELDNEIENSAQDKEVTLCVRPEDLSLKPSGDKSSNSAEVKVEGLEFLGAFFRAKLAIEGLNDCPVTIDFPPNMIGELEIQVGGQLAVVFPKDRINVFKIS